MFSLPLSPLVRAKGSTYYCVLCVELFRIERLFYYCYYSISFAM